MAAAWWPVMLALWATSAAPAGGSGVGITLDEEMSSFVQISVARNASSAAEAISGRSMALAEGGAQGERFASELGRRDYIPEEWPRIVLGVLTDPITSVRSAFRRCWPFGGDHQKKDVNHGPQNRELAGRLTPEQMKVANHLHPVYQRVEKDLNPGDRIARLLPSWSTSWWTRGVVPDEACAPQVLWTAAGSYKPTTDGSKLFARALVHTQTCTAVLDTLPNDPDPACFKNFCNGVKELGGKVDGGGGKHLQYALACCTNTPSITPGAIYDAADLLLRGSFEVAVDPTGANAHDRKAWDLPDAKCGDQVLYKNSTYGNFGDEQRRTGGLQIFTLATEKSGVCKKDDPDPDCPCGEAASLADNAAYKAANPGRIEYVAACCKKRQNLSTKQKEPTKPTEGEPQTVQTGEQVQETKVKEEVKEDVQETKVKEEVKEDVQQEVGKQ